MNDGSGVAGCAVTFIGGPRRVGREERMNIRRMT
jgi:hypothetical protein